MKAINRETDSSVKNDGSNNLNFELSLGGVYRLQHPASASSSSTTVSHRSEVGSPPNRIPNTAAWPSTTPFRHPASSNLSNLFEVMFKRKEQEVNPNPPRKSATQPVPILPRVGEFIRKIPAVKPPSRRNNVRPNQRPPVGSVSNEPQASPASTGAEVIYPLYEKYPFFAGIESHKLLGPNYKPNHIKLPAPGIRHQFPELAFPCPNRGRINKVDPNDPLIITNPKDSNSSSKGKAVELVDLTLDDESNDEPGPSVEMENILGKRVKLGTVEGKEDEKALERMRRVWTREGDRVVDGFLYKYNEDEVIVCKCHGARLSPLAFLKHVGATDLSRPLGSIIHIG